MRYYELNDELKKKYGPELLDVIEKRRKAKTGADKIEDWMLVDDLNGGYCWIFYPDID